MKRSSERRLDGKIPARIKYTFAFGALGKDMIYGMIATFSMIYFTDIIKVNPVFIGAMFFVAKLWDAFNDLIDLSDYNEIRFINFIVNVKNNLTFTIINFFKSLAHSLTFVRYVRIGK